jgi:hypothetical protein
MVAQWKDLARTVLSARLPEPVRRPAGRATNRSLP